MEPGPLMGTYSDVIDMLVRLIREGKPHEELLAAARQWEAKVGIKAELILGDARGVAAGV